MLFKVSDKFHSHPKVMAADGASIGLWVMAGSWSAEHETFGFIPNAWVLERDGQRMARRLIKAGLSHWAKDGFWITGDGLFDWARDDRRPNIPDELRQRIYDRDGHRCIDCGSSHDLTLDHIFPWSLGGPDTEDNLRTLCRSCNSRKGARLLEVD